MANSDFLRKNKNQHSIKNSISKKMDGDIDVAVQKLLTYLRKKYHALIFEHKKKLSLVAEVKRQGTNDKRATEGLAKQAKGNAIERLGKNLTGVRAIFKKESMIPFVCFGSGHDFQKESTILDRVVTMNDFFPLNKVFIEKEHLPFEPVSLFFRYKDWSTKEMTKILTDVAEEAIEYHFN